MARLAVHPTPTSGRRRRRHPRRGRQGHPGDHRAAGGGRVNVVLVETVGWSVRGRRRQHGRHLRLLTLARTEISCRASRRRAQSRRHRGGQQGRRRAIMTEAKAAARELSAAIRLIYPRETPLAAAGPDDERGGGHRLRSCGTPCCATARCSSTPASRRRAAPNRSIDLVDGPRRRAGPGAHPSGGQADAPRWNGGPGWRTPALAAQQLPDAAEQRS